MVMEMFRYYEQINIEHVFFFEIIVIIAQWCGNVKVWTAKVLLRFISQKENFTVLSIKIN